MLAYSLRAREYARRVFRSIGYAPLVFISLDELSELGPAASTLDMLLIGDAPSMDSQGRPVLLSVRELVGPTVPLLNVRLKVAAGSMPPPTDVATASPRFFGELCVAILSLLDAIGIQKSPPRLTWGSYTFEPTGRVVTFDDRAVRLDPVAFDIALELFFRAGQVVNKKTLTLMLPSNEQGQDRQRIDNIGTVIKELRSSLRLRDMHGWRLETLPHLGYRLALTDGTVEKAPARPAAHWPPREIPAPIC